MLRRLSSVNIQEFVGCLIPLLLAAASWLLFVKQRRVALLVALAGALLLLAGVIIEVMLGPSVLNGPRVFAATSFAQWGPVTGPAALLVGMTLFVLGYLWYAVSAKRI